MKWLRSNTHIGRDNVSVGKGCCAALETVSVFMGVVAVYPIGNSAVNSLMADPNSSTKIRADVRNPIAEAYGAWAFTKI